MPKVLNIGCSPSLEAGVDWYEAKNIGLRVNRFAIPAAILSAGLLSSAAQAMQIRQFDKMSDRDQSEYIGNLIVGAENALTDEGKPDLAAQIKHLFTTKNNPRDESVLGMLEFEMNLAQARVVDAERAERDPNARRIEVEDAMLATLQKNNIPPTKIFVRDFRAINGNFRPKLPPQP